MADLRCFLTALRRAPFSFGETDCALTIADWWHANHGADPALHLRGTYSDRDGCAAVLTRERGLLRLVWRLARSVGARRTHDPNAGDFAVVRFQQQHFGAIRTASGRWAIKMSDGLTVTTECRIIMAWAI